jgi:nitrite reductase (NADH) small subunit
MATSSSMPLADLPEGGQRVLTCGGEDVAVFRVGDQVFALSNACPHRGGPLAAGTLIGFEIHCPLHSWSFDVRTGVCTSHPGTNARRCQVRIEHDVLVVDSQPL